MRLALHLVPSIALAGCGGLAVPPDGAQGLAHEPLATSTETAWQTPSWETPSTWQASGETYRLGLRPVQVPGMDPALWQMPDELAFEVLGARPDLVVRVAAVIADSEPAKQDTCLATSFAVGSVDADGLLNLPLDPDQLELGQDWSWDYVEINAVRVPGSSQLHSASFTVGVPLTTLIELAPTLEPCSQDGAFEGFDCKPCQNAPGDCAILELSAESARLEDGTLEPIDASDVLANPEC